MSPEPSSHQRERTDSTDPTERAEPADTLERIDPMDPADRADPTEPALRIDPTDPMLRMEPTDPMDRIDPRLAIDSRDASDFSDRSPTTESCHIGKRPPPPGGVVARSPDSCTGVPSRQRAGGCGFVVRRPATGVPPGVGW